MAGTHGNAGGQGDLSTTGPNRGMGQRGHATAQPVPTPGARVAKDENHRSVACDSPQSVKSGGSEASEGRINRRSRSWKRADEAPRRPTRSSFRPSNRPSTPYLRLFL